MSTARRAVLVLALIAAMVVALSGMASAEPPDHASCFGKSESVDKEGPGEGISDIATSAAHTRTTPVAAQLVPFLQESTHTLCQQGQ